MGLGEVIGILIFVIIMSIVAWKYGFRPKIDELRKDREKLFHEFYDKEEKK